MLTVVLAAGCVTEPAADPGNDDRPAGSPPSSATADAPSPGSERGSTGAALAAPRPARSPGRLAARLVAAETVARSPATSPDDRARAAFETQLLYRQLARRDQWLRPVLRAVEPSLRPTVRAHVTARREFRGMHTQLARTLPTWRIVDPAPAGRLLAYYRAGERRFGVPWEVLAAVHLVETGMGRIRGTSVAGARGPMQFMPQTWAAFGRGDIDDDRDAILAAARYLAHNGGGRGRVDAALYAYNRHPAYVRGVQAYAEVLRADPRAYAGLHGWQVVYLSAAGDVWLPTGYRQRRSVPVRSYLARHPEHLLGSATD
ncbi:lytic transglycosylase domain-containing protein [Nocardioides pantholopis]|uniref:lytic transglycosylase domain-containing protein n=1 Tax=Nocardioides pantholopis TaxID=2483798 RepID=UPI000F08107D|nr:transglycosylase SLT domain-containing protein [Nocardioides pantholopis]